MTAVVARTTPTGLLDDPRAITPAWLTGVLRGSSAIDAATAIAHAHVERFGDGSAMLSRLYRIELRYDGSAAGAPRSVVVKLASDDPEQRFTAELLGLYRREALVYRTVVVELPYRTPRCHFAAVSADGAQCTLVLEDLLRCRFADQMRGASRRAVAASIDAMAAQHARWAGDARLDELASTLWPLDHPVYPEALGAVFDAGWARVVDVLGDRIDPRVHALASSWSEQCGTWLHQLAREPTLLHGDWRADNVFFDGPTWQIGMLDFQIAGIGNGAYDLAYFVSQSVAPARQRNRDRPLLERYAARLAQRGAPVDLDRLWHEYRTALRVCLVYPVSLFRSYESRNPRGRALVETMFTRASTALARTC
ncbi:MAG: phosphotransferase [Acidimicrobiia bacterium]